MQLVGKNMIFDDDTRDISVCFPGDKIQVVGNSEMEYMGYKMVSGVVKETDDLRDTVVFECWQTARLEEVKIGDGVITKL